MMSKPHELKIDLKLFGKLSHFKFPLRERERKATWQLHSKRKKKSFFLNCPEINSLFSFPCNAKKITVLLMFLSFSFKFRYFNLLFSFYFFFLFWLKSVVDASLRFRLHLKAGQAAGWWMSSAIGRCLLKWGWPWRNVESWQRCQEIPRATIFRVFAGHRCYLLHVEE